MIQVNSLILYLLKERNTSDWRGMCFFFCVTIQPCGWVNKNTAQVYLQRIFINSGIWRLAIIEDSAAQAAAEQHQLWESEMQWLNSY